MVGLGQRASMLPTSDSAGVQTGPASYVSCKRSAGGLVRTGSVSQRSRTDINGHQRSPRVNRNRRSPALQFKQLG
jgi:hypothetical protein